jgi:putative peptidoglycan lipid II flippase
VGLTGLILVKILAPAFYARQDIRTPVRISLLTLAATQVMNLIFIVPLQHTALALSIGLASCLNAGLLFHGLRKRGVYVPQAGWGRFVMKLAVALIALGVVLWFAMGREDSWLQPGALERALRLAGVVGMGLAAYFGTLWLLGFRLADFKRRAP